MDERSKGSHLRGDLALRAGLAAALFGGFTAAVGGCPGPAPQAISGNGGNGGESSSSSSSSSSSASSSASSSSGAMACSGDADCAPPPGSCKTGTCANNTCVFSPKPKGDPCKGDFGNGVCNDSKQCVACLDDTHCPDATAGHCDTVKGECVECVLTKHCVDANTTNICEGTKHTAPPTCASGTCVPGATKDCALLMPPAVCTPVGCGECNATTACKQQPCAAVSCNLTTFACDVELLPGGTQCFLSATPATAALCNANHKCQERKYVFLSSEIVSGNLEGVMGADNKCGELASAAGLDGEWFSWTSDVLSTPATRFPALLAGQAIYVDLDEVLVADDWQDLIDGTLDHGIDLTETSVHLPGELVWTGTKPDGIHSGKSCSNWQMPPGGAMGTVGLSGAIDGGWTKSGDKHCDANTKAHLYCFQK